MRNGKIYGLLVAFMLLLQVNVSAGAKAGADFYYSIHNGSYQNEKNAAKYAESIEENGIPAFVEKSRIPGKGVWYRVYIGKYGSLKEAKKATLEIRKKNIKDLGAIKKFVAVDSAVVDRGVNKQAAANVLPTVTPEKRPVDTTERLGSKGATGVKFPMEKASSGGGALAGKPPVQMEHAVVIPALEKPRKDFEAGRYSDAIGFLSDFIAAQKLDNQTLAAALLLLADSWYKTGVKGDAQALMKAVENYKKILLGTPDPTTGNDRVYCYMAKSYQKLKFISEAASSWDAIVSKYPDSPCFEEALFQSGYVLAGTSKKGEVSERMMKYIKKFPDGVFAKMAYYAMGDSLYRNRNLDHASRWFDAARRKWPDFTGVSENILESAADCYSTMARYDEAFLVSSYLANINPAGELGKKASFIMARSADKSGQIDLAVKLYGLFIEKFPQSREAADCELALANLGVENDGANVSANVGKIGSYLNPIKTYDSLLAKGGGADIEFVMFWKGKALEKKGDHLAAVYHYIDMLGRYPQGKYVNEVLQNIKNTVAAFVDGRYERGDYTAVADLYYRLKGRFPVADDYKTGIKIAHSLRNIGLYSEAKDIYGKLQGTAKDASALEITTALAWIDIALKDSVAAEYKLRQISGKGAKRGNKVVENLTRNLADLYLEQGNYEKASALYSTLDVRGVTHDVLFYVNYGRALAAKKKTAEALKIFTTALSHCDGGGARCEGEVISGIYAGMGETYSLQGQFDKGVAMYKKALDFTVNNENKKWLMLRIGQGYRNMDEPEAAEKSFSRIKETPDGNFWPGVADFFISQGVLKQDARGRQ